ncbi:MAG TPA: hypothetical protein VIE69_06935 [Methylophilaceae bacterium]|jgi:hypothetical protein
MKRLSPEQRQISRKQLVEFRYISSKVSEGKATLEDGMKAMADLTNLLDTLAIACGVFDESGEVQDGD